VTTLIKSGFMSVSVFEVGSAGFQAKDLNVYLGYVTQIPVNSRLMTELDWFTKNSICLLYLEVFGELNTRVSGNSTCAEVSTEVSIQQRTSSGTTPNMAVIRIPSPTSYPTLSPYTVLHRVGEMKRSE